jgi:hypothetical protein
MVGGTSQERRDGIPPVVVMSRPVVSGVREREITQKRARSTPHEENSTIGSPWAMVYGGSPCD